jgi:uncharacterized membrane protein
MAIALLALIGIFDAAYLWYEQFAPVPSVCPTGGGCAAVAASPFSILFGVIPIAAIGLLGYIALFALGLLSLHRDTLADLPLAPALVALSAVGVTFSLYLVYLQLAVIRQICFWCMLSAVVQLLIGVATLVNLRAWLAQRQTPETSPPGVLAARR